MPMHKIIEHDAITNTTIERDANKDELAQMKIDVAYEASKKAEAQEKEAAKAAILDRLGLTADELKTILG